MTPEQAKSAIPILEALSKGEQIQFRAVGNGITEWRDLSDRPGEGFVILQGVEWRVKPKPREWWIVDASDSGFDPPAFRSRAQAELFITKSHPREIIHVREVL